MKLDMLDSDCFAGSMVELRRIHLHHCVMAMMAKSNKVVPQRLPPMERAAHYHSLRVHLQVVRWTVLSNDMLQANEWGWNMANDYLGPVMTDRAAAPAKVLQFIRCMCKLTGKNPCGTKQCTKMD